ncbi:MAG: 1-deoxy-D-xylulose-5-phosphate reductoisomerase [Waddliaceae bacterium]
MKKIAILGSTGSIGQSTLKVARHLKDQLEVTAIASGENIDLLEEQAKEFNPKLVAVANPKKAQELKKRLPGIRVVGGMQGVEEVASLPDAELVVSAIKGTMGLAPTVAAIKAGKDIALANKEALVSGGSYLVNLVQEYSTEIIPVDSEHCALFQCLRGERKRCVERLILTASGGPFLHYSEEDLNKITIAQALKHPTWSMGPKVTIDSSTLMNKGLEAIEAHFLFDIPVDKIDVIIHPQSIVHSMVEFVDHSILAQMGITDMVLPIQYALTYPNRLPGMFQPFDFTKHSRLDFFTPDTKRFQCLDLAFQSIKEGGSLPCFMNAANEVLVHRFLEGEIKWTEIGTKLSRLMEKHQVCAVSDLTEIQEIDQEARLKAKD